MGIFDSSCELLLLYLLYGFPHSSPPSQSKRTVYTNSVWLWEGGGEGVDCVADHILQEFNSLFQIQNLQNFSTTTKNTSKDDI